MHFYRNNLLFLTSRWAVVFYLILLLPFNHLNAQPFWYQSLGGNRMDEALSICTDNQDNVYTTGYFSSTIFLDSITLISSGASDIFITKYDKYGEMIWIAKAGGAGVDKATAIKSDDSGNIYITGTFYGTATFSNRQITSNGGEDIFIAKYNSTGSLVWVISGGGLQNDKANDLIIFQNKITITGDFIGNATFLSHNLTSFQDTVTGLPSQDAYILQIDSAGAFSWLKKGGSKYLDKGTSINADDSGNIYVTGTFSDTAIFDSVHPNNMYNSIFVIKYDAAGNEVWWRTLGGGIYNVASAIEVDKNSDIIVTGNFSGQLFSFGTTTSSIQGAFPYNIFTAKYHSDGQLIWMKSFGSDGYVNSRDLESDDFNNIFICGEFECTMTEFSSVYGSGTFNNVGFKDVYYTKLNPTGDWTSAYQYGGRDIDFANGITIFNHAQPVLCGSYKKDVYLYKRPYFTQTGDFCSTCLNPDRHCVDSLSTACVLISNGESDIYVLNGADSTLPIYYYYGTLDTLCLHPQQDIFITNNFPTRKDTITFCKGDNIEIIVNTRMLPNRASPQFNYLWSTGEVSSSIRVNSSQLIWLQMTSIDGCYQRADTLIAIAHDLPPTPLITDSKGINFSDSILSEIHLCKNDSVQFNIINAANYIPIFYAHGIVDTGDAYFTFFSENLEVNPYPVAFVLKNEHGCESGIRVTVYVDSALRQISPVISFFESTNDSIEICIGNPITLYLYDSISNPAGTSNVECDSIIEQFSNCVWNCSPFMSSSTTCHNQSVIEYRPQTSGIYTIGCTMNRSSPCGGIDTLFVQKTINVIVHPYPILNTSITGDTLICPSDSVLLTATGGGTYHWTAIHDGLIHGNSDSSSIYAMLPDDYRVSITLVNQWGCVSNSIMYQTISSPPSPIIYTTPPNSVICPGDSVQLYSNSSGIITWINPYGLQFTQPSLYTSIPGTYYCISDSAGCNLISNTLEITQYATPYIYVYPSSVLCPDDTISLFVVASNSSIVQWDVPFSGSDSVQLVTSPGTYSCSVNSCGINTSAQTIVTPSYVNASISPPGPFDICEGDTIQLWANPGMIQYIWNYNYNFSPRAEITTTGNYFVTTFDGYGCSATSNVVSINPVIQNHPTADSITTCMAVTIKLNVAFQPGIIYQWAGPGNLTYNSNNLEVFPATIETGGNYIMTQTIGTCIEKDTVNVSILSSDDIGIEIKSEPCMNQELTLSPLPINNSYNYEWITPTGNIINTISYTIPYASDVDTGLYHLIVSIDDCRLEILKQLDLINCDSEIVNIITPNNDGKNDVFEINSSEPVSFELFNRWGNKIFECLSCNQIRWDGTDNGKQIPNGTYYYIFKSRNQLKRGWLQVIK